MQSLEIVDFGSASGSDLTDDSDDDDVDEEEIAEYLNTLQIPGKEQGLTNLSQYFERTYRFLTFIIEFVLRNWL